MAVLAGALALGEAPALWADPASAPCPKATPASDGEPTSVVVVSVLSVDPQSDLEGGDGAVPLWDNHADIKGTVTINGVAHELPEKTDSDHPFWGEEGRFRMPVSSSPVAISIAIREGDSGATGDDDTVDINPATGKERLDLAFDLCSLEVWGDISRRGTQQVIEVSGGTDSDDATIRLKIEMEDGRPRSSNDLAVVDVDVVQVVHDPSRLVAGKPAVVMVRAANNYSFSVSTQLRLQVSGGGLAVDDTFPLTPGSG